MTSKTTIPWTPERLKRAEELWKEGKTSVQVAEILKGISKGAVCGMANRRGWKQGERPVKFFFKAPKVKRAHIQPPKPGPQNSVPVVFGDIQNEKSEEAQKRWFEYGQAAIKRVEGADAGSISPKPFAQANGGCKWPIGEGKDLLICCNTIHKGPYCKEHAAIAYTSRSRLADVTSLKSISGMTRHDRVRHL